MICENCGIEHNGNYGSGRFCSSKCSHSFSAISNNKQRIKNIKTASQISIEEGRHNNFSGTGEIIESTWCNELVDRGFTVERNYPVDCKDIQNNNHFYRIDILVNGIVDLEIDGKLFHKDTYKDNKRDEYLKSLGFKVYRVPYINPKRKQKEFISQVSEFIKWYRDNV